MGFLYGNISVPCSQVQIYCGSHSGDHLGHMLYYSGIDIDQHSVSHLLRGNLSILSKMLMDVEYNISEPFSFIVAEKLLYFI